MKALALRSLISKARIPLITVVVLAIIPLFITNRFILTLFYMYFLWLSLGQAWNFAAGYGGEFSFGHALFFGLGGYTCALLWLNGVNVYLSIVAGGLIVIPAGMGVAYLCKGLKGGPFAIATMAFQFFVQAIFMNTEQVGSTLGLTMPPTFHPTVAPHYWITLTLLVFTMVMVWVYVKSRRGLALMAIRDDETASRTIGIGSARIKMEAFGLSAIPFGIGGGFWTFLTHYIVPGHGGVFDPSWSVYPIILVLMGGIGTFIGPILGAAFYVAITQALTFTMPLMTLMFIGIAFLLVALFFPRGAYYYLSRYHYLSRMRAQK